MTRRRADLATAKPGFYVVDAAADLVLNIDSPARTAEDAQKEAQRLAGRTGRVFSVSEVVDLVVGAVEACQNEGCSAEMSVVLAPQGWLHIPGVVEMVPGQQARLCEQHARELRDVARVAGVDLAVVK